MKVRLLLILIFLGIGNAFSCNLSDLTLVSVTGTGPYTIVVRLCVGQGITGTTKGADQDTRSIGFNFFGSGINLISFLPANVTGSYTGCTMPGANIGPQGAPYNSDLSLIYIDPGYYGMAPCVTQPYACKTSTALCGNVSQNCTNFTFVTNIMPTMIEAFGVEGGGNPIAGCWPDADMRITSFVLPVEWNEVKAKVINTRDVQISWSTSSEMDVDYYVVEKVYDFSEHHLDWISCDTIKGTNSTQLTQYYFVDENVSQNLLYYRIKEIDISGKFSYSTMMIVYMNQYSVLKVYPNPANHTLKVETNFYDRFQLFNYLGRTIISETNIDLEATNSIDVSSFPKGIYYIELKNSSGEKLTKQVILE